MKKLLFLFLASFLAPFCTRAQDTFAPVGAEWWFQYSFHDYGSETNPYLEGNFHTRSVSDTIISGINCHKVITVQQERNSYYPDSIFTTQQKTFYFYDNTDTAFIYNDNFGKFTPCMYLIQQRVIQFACRYPLPGIPIYVRTQSLGTLPFVS